MDRTKLIVLLVVLLIMALCLTIFVMTQAKKVGTEPETTTGDTTQNQIVNDDPIEITTYRVDGEYTDSRRPDAVRFTTSIEDDLSRRDFTVNAMAYSDVRGLVDLFGGRADLESKIIRAVGDPEKRFTEDALRIMRAFRFSAQLDFEIEKDTLEAALKLRKRL